MGVAYCLHHMLSGCYTRLTCLETMMLQTILILVCMQALGAVLLLFIVLLWLHVNLEIL